MAVARSGTPPTRIQELADWLRRPLGKLYFRCLVLVAGATLLASSAPVPSVWPYFILVPAWAGLGATWMTRFLAAAALRALRGGLKAFALAALTAVAVAAVSWSGVARIVRFKVSEPAMTWAAKRIIQDPDSRIPPLLGLYPVRERKPLEGSFRFITGRAGFADDAGFAYCPRSPCPVDGEDSYEHLSGRWYVWYRSW